jgi:Cro/C1-type HTH DNA-binding domain
MEKKSMKKDFLASKGGIIFLEKNKFELGLTFEDTPYNTGLASVDQVKRLFHPRWKNSRIQRDTIDKIARVLNLDPADIIATGDSEHYG